MLFKLEDDLKKIKFGRRPLKKSNLEDDLNFLFDISFD